MPAKATETKPAEKKTAAKTTAKKETAKPAAEKKAAAKPAAEKKTAAKPAAEKKPVAKKEAAAPKDDASKEKKKKQYVAPHPDGGWQVKLEGSSRATKRFDRKVDAEKYAKELAEKQGTSYLRQKKDGKMQKKRYD